MLALEADCFFFITDDAVRPFAADVSSFVARDRPVVTLPFVPSETTKALGTVERLINEMLDGGATRASCVVSVGGGVTGNIAGLCAALMYRGVRLVHVPTTLMAAADSVLSLKQGVNTRHGKNLVGTYHPPVAVLVDTAVLAGLPLRQRRAGLCETIKNALAIEPAMIEPLLSHLTPECELTPEFLEWIIGSSIAAKARVAESDPYERHTALVLEYGHTVGHAIEHASRGAIVHGEAVGLGMIAAAHISMGFGWLSAEEAALHRELVSRLGAPVTLGDAATVDEVVAAVGSDNKRGYRSTGSAESLMILLRGIGIPNFNDGIPLTAVPRDRIYDAVRALA